MCMILYLHFFYVRTLDLRNMKKGQIFYLQNFFDDTTHSLGVKMMGRETIEVEAGTFRCVVIQPLVMEGGLFKSEGNIFIWVTDDDRKNTCEGCHKNSYWFCWLGTCPL